MGKNIYCLVRKKEKKICNFFFCAIRIKGDIIVKNTFFFFVKLMK
ncbi:hypothetical protein, partial [Plasmodium yoelii yoelii]